MKHLYKLLFIFCFISASQAQINSYFNNNPCWQQKSMCQIGQTCYTVNVYNYFVGGDTIIGTTQYKKVYKKGYSYSQYLSPTPPTSGNPCLSPPPTYYYSASLSFFIRSNGKKIYVLNAPFAPGGPSCNGDTLLYDFNLQVGDTLPNTCNNPWSSNTFTVTAIDSVNTFNGWMKRFKLNNNPGYDFIEGMGYMNGLIELMPPNVMSCGWQLQCYSQNNTAYYPSSGPSCMLTTKFNEREIATQPLVYPNPSSGKYNLVAGSFSEARIEIFNTKAQLIQRITPEKEITEIDISLQPQGIYFLKYTSGNSNSYSKLIKD
jgi:hypothetical protein